MHDQPSTLFTPCWSMVQLLLRTILMPVRSQFRINSRGDFFHFHSGYHIFQNSLFTQSKSVMAYLLFAVVAFLWTKFIRCSNVYAQCQLSSTCPPNSTNMDLSQVKTIPQQQPLQSVLIYTTPPPSSNTTAPSDPKHHPAELIFLASWLVAQRGHHYLLLFCFLSSLPSKLV